MHNVLSLIVCSDWSKQYGHKIWCIYFYPGM